MAESRNITRRAAIVGAAVSTAALAVPVAASAARPIYGCIDSSASPEDRFRAAFAHLRDAAIAMDPTIKGAWAGWADDEMNGSFRLTTIIFDRDGSALQRAKEMRG